MAFCRFQGLARVGVSLCVLLFLSVLLNRFHVDTALADWLYQMQGGQWLLKDHWLTAVLVHKGGKYLSAILLTGVVLMGLLSLRMPRWAEWRRPLWYIVISFAVGTVLVSWGKSVTHVSCPWDFDRYGGQMEYLSWFKQLWVRNGSHCFPAGHASTGYGWLALYFVGLHYQSRWRWAGLGFAVGFGLVCGIAQQLRGAHFLSHDLWSFGVCWIVAQVVDLLMLQPTRTQQSNTTKH
jgi:membrane-associated PAP2 superfamily phosphatase